MLQRDKMQPSGILLSFYAVSKDNCGVSEIGTTIKILKIRTPKKFAVLTLKYEQGGFTAE